MINDDGLLCICAGGSETIADATPIGIGANCSIKLVEILSKEKSLANLATTLNMQNLQEIKMIAFIGTAGSYDKSIEIGDICISSTASQIELSYIENKSYTPIDNCVSIDVVSYETFRNIYQKLIKNYQNIKELRVNSSNYISTDFSTTNNLLKANISLENMEFYTILSVAKYFNIPAFGIFVVTNYTNEFAHRDFLQNSKNVKVIMKKVIKILNEKI